MRAARTFIRYVAYTRVRLCAYCTFCLPSISTYESKDRTDAQSDQALSHFTYQGARRKKRAPRAAEEGRYVHCADATAVCLSKTPERRSSTCRVAH
ncbi:hypothetical protein BKA80DRAFT_282599 [Phyllosticta citrichinensis]